MENVENNFYTLAIKIMPAEPITRTQLLRLSDAELFEALRNAGI